MTVNWNLVACKNGLHHGGGNEFKHFRAHNKELITEFTICVVVLADASDSQTHGARAAVRVRCVRHQGH